MSYKRWTDAEVNTLRELAGTLPPAQIAERLARSVDAVRMKAYKLGISLDYTRKRSSDPQELASGDMIKSLRTRLHRYEKQQGEYLILAEEIAKVAPGMPTPKKLTLRATPTKRAQEMVALFSDSHSAEAWEADQTDGLSRYDFDAFCRAIAAYARTIIRFADEFRPSYGLKTLHIDFLGDIYHGSLRLDDEVTNDFGTALGTTQTAAVLFQWLLMLSEHFERIEAHCMAGNHGRLHSKPQSKRYVGENLDTLIYAALKLMVRAKGLEDRIRITIPNSRTFTFDRMGHKILIAHGDHVRGGNSIANIPIYGLSRDMLRKTRQEFYREAESGRRQGIKLMEIGHFHNTNFLEDVMLMNGAIAPADPYAVDQHGAVSQQKQWVYFCSEQHAYGWVMPVSLKSSASEPHPFAIDPHLIGG